MHDYQLLQLGFDGEVVGQSEFCATSDETAINFAASVAGLQGVEVWNGDSFVALVNRDGLRPAGDARAGS